MKNSKKNCDELRLQLAQLQHEYDVLKQSFDQNQKHLQQVAFTLGERMKELNCQNEITSILGLGELPVNDVCQKIAEIIPDSFQFPEHASASITLNDYQYKTPGFKLSKRTLTHEIIVKNQPAGRIVVAYPDDVLSDRHDVFLPEETTLLTSVAFRLGNYISAKEKEKSLLDSEDNYRQMFSDNPQPMWIFDMETLAFLQVNDAAINLYGYSRDEFLNMTLKDIRPKEEIPMLLNELSKNFDIHVIQGVIQHLWKNGETRNVKISYHNMNYRGRNARHVMVTDVTDQILAEKKLKQSEEKYRMLVENQNELVVRVDAENKFTYVSPSYCSLFGKTEEELLGRSFYPLVHEDDVKTTEEAMKNLFHSPYSCYIEQRALTVKGWRWLAWSDKAQVNEKGEIISVLGTGRDITERMMAENALRASEEQFRAVSEYSVSSICILNSEAKILWVNDAMLRMSGYSDEALYAAKSFAGFVAPESKEFVISNFLKFAHQQPYEHHYRFSIIRADGEKRLCEKYMTHYTDQNGDRNLIVSMLDVTEQEQAQQKITRLNERLTLANRAAKIGIWDWDIVNNRLEWDENMYELYGRSKAQFAGAYEAWLDAILPEDKPMADTISEQARNGLREYDTVFRILLPDGTVKHIRAFGDVLCDETGKATRMVGVNIDITGEVKKQETIRESEARFQSAFHYAAIGMTLVSPKGNFLKANHALCSMLGYTEEELRSKTFMDLTFPDDLDADLTFVAQLLEGKILTYQMEKRYFHKTGKIIWALLSVSLVRNEKGSPVFFISQVQNITAHKEAEELIRKERDFSQTILNSTQAHYAVIDQEGKILAINEAWRNFARSHGADPDETKWGVGSNYFEASSNDLFGGMDVIEMIKSVQSGECLLRENEYQSDDADNPRWFWMRVSPVQGTKGHVLISQVDITERKHAEIQEIENQKTFRILNNLMSDYIFKLTAQDDGQFKMSVIAGNYTLTTGRNQIDAVTPDNWDKIVHPDDLPLLNKQFRKILADRKPIGFECRSFKPDGTLRWIEIVATADTNESGTAISAVYGSIRNITDRKLSELRLRDSESKYRNLVENLQSGIVVFDSNCKIILSNSEANRIFRFTDEQLKGIKPFDPTQQFTDDTGRILTPDEHPVSLVLKTGAPLFDRIYGIGLPGSENRVWLQASVYPEFVTDVQVKHAVFTFTDITTLVNTREILRKSEERWSNLIKNSPDGIAVISMEGTIQYVSEKLLQWHGYDTMDEMVGENVFNYIDAQHRENAMSNFKRMLAGDYGKTSEYKLIRKDGSRFWVEVAAEFLTDTNGRPESIFLIERDITERRNIEESIRLSEQKFRIVADNTYNWEFWEGTDKQFLYHSPSCKKITGYEARELLIDRGLFRRLIHPDDREEYRKHHRQAKSSKKPGSHIFRIINRQGETRHIEHVCQPVFDDKNNYLGIRGTNIDVTDRVKNEELLRKLSLTVEQSPVSVLITNLNGEIEYVNPRFEQVTGYTLHEVAGKNPRILNAGFQKPEIYKALWDKILADGEWRGELKNKKKNGELYWEYATITPIRDKSGKTTHFLAVKEDITQRKASEKRIIESEKRYRTLFETMNQGVIYYDANGKIIAANPSAERILDLSIDQMMGKDSGNKKYITYDEPGHELPPEKHPVAKALKTGTPQYAILGIRLPARANLVWAKVSSYPEFREGEKTPFQVYTTIEDITPLKTANEALNKINRNLEERVEQRTAEINAALESLRESEERFYNMFHQHAAVMLLINPADGEVVEANKAAEMFYGYNFNAQKKIHISEINSLSEKEINSLMLDASVHHQNYFVFPHKLASGEIRTVEAHATPIEIKGKQVLFSIIHDITKRKEAEVALINSRNTLTQITDSVPVFIALADTNLCYTFINSAYESFFGMKKEEIIGKPVKDILGDEAFGRAHPWLLKALQGEPSTFENHLVNVKGESRDIHTSYSPYYNNNRIEGILATVVDITERKRSEALLMKSEAENRAIIDSMPDMLFRIHRDGTYIDYKCKKDSDLYVPKEVFLGKKMMEILPPELAVKSMQSIENAFIDNKTVQYEYSLPIGKETRHFENRIVAISENEVLSIIRDITERIRNENFTRMQKEFAIALTAISNMNQALELTISTMLEIPGVDCGGIYLVDAETKIPKLIIHKGLSAKFAEMVADYKPDAAQIKHVFSGEPLFGSYKDIIPDHFSEEERDYIKSLAIFPLQHQGSIIGIINLCSRSMTEIPKEISGRIESLVNQAGQAISRIYAEKALLSSKQNFQMLFDTIDDFMFILDHEGKMMITNPVVQHRLGYTADELSAMHVLEIHPPERREEAGFIVNEMLAGRELFCPVPLYQKNGGHIPVETRVIKGKWDGKDALYGISRDITERRKAEVALRRQSAAFESFALAIIITDINGKIQWANTGFTKLSGYSPDEIIGKTPGGLVRSGHQDKEFYGELWDTIRQGQVWSGELINIRKDGTLYYEEQTITPVKDDEGNIINFIAIKIDITERKKLFHELATEKRRLADIINGTNAGTWEWNVQTGETIFNEQWAAIIGYTLDEISPVNIETWTKFAHPDDLKASEELLKRHFNGELEHYSFESRMKHKNGEWVWVLDRGKVHEWDSKGQPVLMSGTHLDITLQKKIEEDLFNAKIEAEKANKAKSEFLSRMSHELRTPMNSILGFAQLLEMGDLNKIHRKGVNYILKSGKHLLDLINEVLDISSIEAGKLSLSIEPVRTRSIIAEMMDILKQSADQKNISMVLKDSEVLDEFIDADKQRAKQVLINLLNNAIKYNHEGGSVVVKTELIPFTDNNRDMLRISVSDTGIGIEPENLQILFNPFERVGAEKTTIEGTGLGLAVVSRLMEVMKGKIGVESTPGVGSTFWVEFPLSTKEANHPGRQDMVFSETDKVSAKTGLILYIEDNISNIDLVDQILTSHTPQIRLVSNSNGAQAQALAASLKPDLILLDLNLPDIHGSEVLQILLSDPNTQSIPVVIISADAMSGQINRLLKAGAKKYLTKPIDLSEFLKVIDNFIA